MHSAQSLINHVALVLDASYSMTKHGKNVIKVADEQIAHLAERSKEMNQETRVSVYWFGDKVECLIFDMDVARLPSINDLYHVKYENTALIAGYMKSQEDLKTTSQLYGDHAFLTFVITDGEENWTHRNYSWRASDMKSELMNAGVNWTVGFLVPNQSGVRYMEQLGALRDAVAIWDTSSAQGFIDVGAKIRKATDTFFDNRSRNIRGTRGIFSTGIDAVNTITVKQNLTPLDPKTYDIKYVHSTTRIDDFFNDVGLTFRKGAGYYQLTKTEDIQKQKDVIVVDKKTNKAYGGPEARHLIGLPDDRTVHVRPDRNPLYDIFVQSTSFNRKLLPNTRLLVKH